MCIAPEWEKATIRERNAQKLCEAMQKDINLSSDESISMDLNALKTDVSWDKGAIQNYMDKMKIKISK